MRLANEPLLTVPDAAKMPLAGVESLMVGGLGFACGRPLGLLRRLVPLLDRPVRVVTCDVLDSGRGWFMSLVELGLVRELVTSFVAGAAAVNFARQLDARGRLELIPQGTFIERVRAAAYGLGPVYVPVLNGDRVGNGKETRVFDDVKHALEYPITCDLALIRAAVADRHGNLGFRAAMRSTNVLMAMAAARSIAEVDALVDVMDPERVEVAGRWVNAVSVVTGEHEMAFEDYHAELCCL